MCCGDFVRLLHWTRCELSLFLMYRVSGVNQPMLLVSELKSEHTYADFEPTNQRETPKALQFRLFAQCTEVAASSRVDGRHFVPERLGARGHRP